LRTFRKAASPICLKQVGKYFHAVEVIGVSSVSPFEVFRRAIVAEGIMVYKQLSGSLKLFDETHIVSQRLGMMVLDRVDALLEFRKVDINDSTDINLAAGVAAITIRNFDGSLKTKLRMRAASHDRSMEEEARAILREALQDEERGLGTLIHERFLDAGGVEVAPPDRSQPARRLDDLE
jgi:antitoxin FitA